MLPNAGWPVKWPYNGGCLAGCNQSKGDKGSMMIRMGVSGWMFLLVPAYPGCPGSKAVKQSLLCYRRSSSRWRTDEHSLGCWCSLVRGVWQCRPLPRSVHADWQPAMLVPAIWRRSSARLHLQGLHRFSNNISFPTPSLSSSRKLGPSQHDGLNPPMIRPLILSKAIYTHTHLTALYPGLPRWAGTRKAKPIWILLKEETVSGSGISWAICKSAPCSRQITTPAWLVGVEFNAPHQHPTTQFFYRPDALPAAQPTVSKHWRHKTKTKLEMKNEKSNKKLEKTLDSKRNEVN